MKMKPIDVRHVKVGGEIGRRIDITVRNNVLVMDIDEDFLSPFRDRSREEGYIGLGKLIDSVVRLVRGRKAQAGRVAIMRGPQVFCLNRGNHPGVSRYGLTPAGD